MFRYMGLMKMMMNDDNVGEGGGKGMLKRERTRTGEKGVIDVLILMMMNRQDTQWTEIDVQYMYIICILMIQKKESQQSYPIEINSEYGISIILCHIYINGHPVYLSTKNGYI